MTFALYENSRSLGKPDTLYRFTVGSTVYAYTDAEQARTHAAITYEPIPIDRDQVASSGTLDKSTLKINVPVTTAIAELFRIFPPSEVVGVTIFQGHAFDDEFNVVFTGRVLSCSRAASQATLGCEPVITSMRRPGLRRRYQRGCPHALYGDKCRVDRSDFTVTAAITAVDGAYITLSNGWNGSFTTDRFEGGLMVADGETRTIVKVLGGNTLLVGGVIAGLAPGVTAALSLGCPHTMDGCTGFDNIHNYGGQPWIPTRNPFSDENQFY